MGRQRRFDPDLALDQAMAVFWRQGYEATSIQDLVSATGVNRASLYATFQDKRGLFLAALERYRTTVSARRAALLDAEGSPLRALRAFFADLVEFSVGEGRMLGCLLTNATVELAPRDPAVAAFTGASLERMEIAFRRTLERARASGELALDADVPALANDLVCSLQGFRVIAKVSADRARLEALSDTILSRLAAPH
jgi:TetR/AcrR family transcriptional repressor of nem operon